MSMGERSCHSGQHSKGGHECPLADRGVGAAGSSVQRRGGHVNVHGWIAGLLLSFECPWSEHGVDYRIEIAKLRYVGFVPRGCAQWSLRCVCACMSKRLKIPTTGAPLTNCG
jgi:hypothetical protein